MRPLKVVAAVLAVLIVLLAAAVAVFAWRFDPDDYKTVLTGWVEERAGRTLAIEDPIELRFFPWLAVETGGVTVGNAASFDTSEPFATIERVAAEVELLPLLLERRVEIGTIRVAGLRLNLARDANGRGNWEDFGERFADAGSADRRDGAASWIDGFDANGVLIRDASVNWRENTTDLRYVASGIELRTGEIGAGRPVDVTLAVDVLDVESQRTFEVESSSGVAIGIAAAATDGAASDGDDDGGTALELHGFGVGLRIVDGAGAELARGRLDADRVRAAGDGRVEVDGARATARLPATSEIAARWSAAAFDPASGSLSTQDLVTSVAGIDARWRLDGRNVIDAPQVDGAVVVAGAPIAAALDALGIALPAGVDTATLGTLDADVRFAVGLEPSAGDADDVVLGPYRLASLDVDVVDARLLGLAFEADAALGDGRAVAGRIDVPAFAPGEPLLALLRAHAPPTLGVDALDRVALAGRFETDLGTGRVALSDLDAELLGARLSGSLDVLPEASGTVWRGMLATTPVDPQALAALAGGALPAAFAPDKLGAVAIDTRFDYDSGSDRATLEDLKLEAFGLAATGRATIAHVSASPAVSGDARIATFSPRDLLRRFDQPVPDTSDDTALRRASLATRFDVDGAGGRFTNLDLTLDDSRITGDFTVTSFDDVGYTFALAIDGVDADRYLPPRAADIPDDAPEGAPKAGDIELPAEALDTIRLRGRVDVGRLRLAGLDFEDVATNIETGNGEGRLDSARAKLYGGEFEGSFHVQAAGDTPGLTLTGRATNLALEPMIVALTGDANVSGTGDFDLRLSGRGARVIDNVRSANGDVTFALRSGAIDGFNLGRAVCAVYNATQRAAAPAEQPAVTAFDVIGGSATVRDGVASSPDLLARTSFMDVSGRGSLTLAEQRLDYDLEAELTGPIGIAGCESMDALVGESIPLTLRGTVTDPDIRPDFSEIIQRRLRDAVQDRLRERVGDRLRELLQ